MFTKSLSHLDVIMGTSSADIMWFEALTQKYNRINKNVGSNPQFSGCELIKFRTLLAPPQYLKFVGYLVPRTCF